ncbi:adenine phosphoribosyltransferase [Pseudoxanthomonas broegbernensis]|uniref:Adenine phosphoribosyltransferase n=1 Tax=Pseudoxanthomonas broegbernensis TaxID=83619 RepID=A0A7V8GK30_9GAMM|nr:adenine phosphoribosyltransferase [Pseudoxanthomonas broegbernensis]KAF1684728.1 adenine phosphoribosyltransferase [Pseudoxanthomonas broegbernensis]MBB6066404.1 adenine phosphoribosyltransferase [Pseudoxanthomonas broegbernensis]
MDEPADSPAWAAAIRDIPDFPSPGIVFKDIAPLLADAGGFAAMLAALAAPWREAGIGAVAGIESRGFILGAALARELDAGFVPLRKPGKLPGRVLEEGYALEYGSDRLQMQADALPPGARVLLVDDVLATGGTLAAAARLLRRQGAVLAGAAVLIELHALPGRARWPSEAPLQSLLRL